jgi:ATP-dependent Lhr-like helicase
MHANVTFHPSVTAWFENHFAQPTQVQAESWPVIASGAHALITAPTGSGKTLTAFMWSLSLFAQTEHEPGRTKVLYISPLKALNNDIQRNLFDPLKALERENDFPHLTVATRSGDTDQSERQRLLRNPPDILITTPESLSLLLTTSKGRMALAIRFQTRASSRGAAYPSSGLTEPLTR